MTPLQKIGYGIFIIVEFIIFWASLQNSNSFKDVIGGFFTVNVILAMVMFLIYGFYLAATGVVEVLFT